VGAAGWFVVRIRDKSDRPRFLRALKESLHLADCSLVSLGAMIPNSSLRGTSCEASYVQSELRRAGIEADVAPSSSVEDVPDLSFCCRFIDAG
jgi:hypothetical protein